MLVKAVLKEFLSLKRVKLTLVVSSRLALKTWLSEYRKDWLSSPVPTLYWGYGLKAAEPLNRSSLSRAARKNIWVLSLRL